MDPQQRPPAAGKEWTRKGRQSPSKPSVSASTGWLHLFRNRTVENGVILAHARADAKVACRAATAAAGISRLISGLTVPPKVNYEAGGHAGGGNAFPFFSFLSRV